MSLPGDKSFRMKMRDVENAFKYRRLPYPKRSVELIALLAISCTFFLFMHTNKLNSRLKEMEVKLQPSEFSALGLTGGNHISGRDGQKHDDINTLHGTYQYLKSTGQRRHSRVQNEENSLDKAGDEGHHHKRDRSTKHESGQVKPLDIPHNGAEDPNSVGNEDEEKYDNVYEDQNDENSLKADDLNNTKKAEVDLVFFNRVPKVGSQSLMELMMRLGHINGYAHSRDVGKAHETIMMKPPQQKELIVDVLTKDKPRAYSQHVAFINFTRFHMPRPIYINLIRDPVERIISWHYYIRAPWYYKDMKDKLGDKAPPVPPKQFMEMDLDTCVKNHDIYCQFNQNEIKNPAGDHRRQTLFFCGQNRKLCMPFNTEAAMRKAMRTVEEDYSVVGTWEDTNITLTVLENYIPRFFKHAKVAYYLGKDRLSKVNKNNVKRPISVETREILRQNLTYEIQFYEFCKQRLYLQYAAINDGNQIDNDDYLLIPEHVDEDGENEEEEY